MNTSTSPRPSLQRRGIKRHEMAQLQRQGDMVGQSLLLSCPFYDAIFTVTSMRSRGLSRPSRLAPTMRSTTSSPLTTSPKAVY